MRISVIIPTFNAGACIGNLLSMLKSQDTAPFEIIVIDSSSADNTVKVAKESGARTIEIPRQTFNHGRTRNIAALEARGDILVFMTQDALPVDNTLLRVLTAPLSEPDIGVAFGRHIPKTDASPLEIFARHFNYPDKGSVKGITDIRDYGIKTFFSSNACSAVKKDLFLKAGMFPEGVRANEDMLIAARLILQGYKLAYVADAKVFHSHNYSLLKQFRRYYNIGSSLRNNKWILDHARPEGEGMKFIRGQVRFVLKQHRFFLVPYIFLESVTKYAGFRIGLIAG
jgi:rhamnosyltransferase